MKKYKVNKAWKVNTHASKTGIKWEYAGKHTREEIENMITEFENNIICAYGLRITDTENNTIIYEKTKA